MELGNSERLAINGMIRIGRGREVRRSSLRGQLHCLILVREMGGCSDAKAHKMVRNTKFPAHVSVIEEHKNVMQSIK